MTDFTTRDGSAWMPEYLVKIDGETCIGCGRCFKKCPFDAIVGAPRLLHGVIADACTGCGLCTNVCPHGGISLYPDLQFAAPLVKPQLGGSRHA